MVSLLARQALRLSDDERAVLQGFVDQAAIAIRNASLHAAEIEARRAAERALAEVRELQGLLPICSYCKSVRNDQNYWQKIESYIGERSRAQFTHGICPDCRETVVAAELAQWRTKEMAAREPVTATRDT